MNKTILNYVNKLEGYKSSIKELHWDAKSLSQHKLCDDIASLIADFQDQVSEVEQSMSGKLPLGKLNPVKYKPDTLKGFVMDVIDSAQDFRKKLEGMGEDYVGMKSDCESFISDMQRQLYLVNFGLQEEFVRGLMESFRKEENIKTSYHGKSPKTEGGMFKRINELTKNGQFNTRKFDGPQEAFDFYKKVLSNVGTLKFVTSHGTNCLVKLNASNGLSYSGLMKVSKLEDDKVKASITFSPHGDEQSNVLEMTIGQLKDVINESVENVLQEAADPTVKIQALIDQANEAYNKAKEAQGGDENPLMDKEGTFYGLSSPIRIDGRGYIIFPYSSKCSWSDYTPQKIRVLTRAGGRIKVIQGDYWDEGWKDARKLLNAIIRDANTGTYHHQNYNPDWEDAETKEDFAEKKAAMRDFNKQAGLRAGTGLDTINKRY